MPVLVHLLSAQAEGGGKLGETWNWPNLDTTGEPSQAALYRRAKAERRV